MNIAISPAKRQYRFIVFVAMKFLLHRSNGVLAALSPFIILSPLVLRAAPGSVDIQGELKAWHAVTLSMEGPQASELDRSPNPFTDYGMFVIFAHESGSPVYSVPGYFAADGNAGNSSASSGNVWRAHLSPDKSGEWRYEVQFRKGEDAALDPSSGKALAPYHGVSGSFKVGRTDKSGRDFRGQGRLQYVGGHYLRFAGTGGYFLKAGPDAPETLLAYSDFDNTTSGKPDKGPLKTWSPHSGDWNRGDPTWGDGRGKNLIGALNYLSEVGVNAFSFLTYNAGGDGDNVWPFVNRNDKFHYDCSKLDQWGVVLAHAQSKGLYLHFKMQENEIDDHRAGAKREPKVIPEALDGGKLGRERKLYTRELIARFGHHLALNWNLGEENTQSYQELNDWSEYIHNLDPYDHNIVIHTFPPQQDEVYTQLLGTKSLLTGASLQNHWDQTHQRTLQWVEASRAAGRPWVVANDEQGKASQGVPPDLGYKGWDGTMHEKDDQYTMHDVRKKTLWANLMAGGAGVEYYFGYQLLENDLVAEDWRSRHKSWEYCANAISFFQDNDIPFWRMNNADALVGNVARANGRFCFAEADAVYVVYLPEGGEAALDLSDASGSFNVQWFDPRNGGRLQRGSERRVRGGGEVSLGEPPVDSKEDWVVLVRK